MVTHGNCNVVHGNASRLGFHLTVAALTAVMLLCGGAPATAQFTSGSSGTHGVFPPPQNGGTVPASTYIVWNVLTGGVRYCSTYTEGTGSDQCNAGSTTNIFVQIPNIPPGGLTTGIYEFTDVQLTTPAGFNRRIVIVGSSSNVPLSILSQGDINISGNPQGNSVTFLIQGQHAPSLNTNFAEAGAKGGPGGFDGAASGNGGSTPGHGSAGFGPAGGAGGQSDAATIEALNGASAGAPPLNYSLTPLTGGSGGGGAAGVSPTNTLGCGTAALGYGGGPGGGGGGALLLAATNRVIINGNVSILAHGGNGGRNNQSQGQCALFGGGGGGGSVRIVAREFTGASSTINVAPGTRQNGTVPAFGGHVRIETALNTFAGTISGAAAGSFLSFPTAPVPSTQPSLRITSVGGTAAPANPSASLVVPDITFTAPIEAPVTVDVGASNVPLGTTVSIRVVPATGQPTTATTSGLVGTVANSTASASVTLPPGAGVVTASASFSIAGGGGGGGGGGAAFNTLPLIDGKPFERVEVAALADGSSRTYLIAHNGVRFELGTASR
jgi:hypothetical protein